MVPQNLMDIIQILSKKGLDPTIGAKTIAPTQNTGGKRLDLTKNLIGHLGWTIILHRDT